MIGYISGKIYRTNESSVIVDVNGVGYEVYCAKNTLVMLKDGQETSFEIYTHINENAFQLFGFTSIHEKNVFQKIISVSGIGPKLGLAVISAFPLSDLLQAIVQSDVNHLTSINGIGKKTAERIILELKDKFKDEVQISKMMAANDNPPQDTKMSDVTNALISLGYPAFQAKNVVNGLAVEEDESVQSLIKRSLSEMRK